MLELNLFRTIVTNAPLVSIDLCLIHAGKMLLGKRSNEPLKGVWFTPGGRVYKNEPWQECLRRVAHLELGIDINNLPSFKFMGIWDHFYENSVIDENVSTHYVNLPHYCILDEKPKLLMDQQHNDLSWINLEEVVEKDNFHEYIQNYASFLIKIWKKYDK